MADDVSLPGDGALVETQQQSDGSHRQVTVMGTVDSGALLSALLSIAQPSWHDPTAGSLRVYLTTGSAAIGSVALQANQNLNVINTVTNLSQIGSTAANQVVFDMMDTAWATNVRGRIT